MQLSTLVRKKRSWFALIFFLYTISGFLLAPWLVKKELVSYVQESLGRQASLETVRVNPYALSVTLRNFAMEEKDGNHRFVGFDELYVNFEVSSLLRWAWTFREISLVSPQVRIELQGDGTWNFSDLLPEPSQEEDAEQDDSLIRLVIKLIKLDSGSLDFVDSSRPTPFELSLSPLSLELSAFHTMPDRHSPYSLVASTTHGEKLEWTGTLSANPVRSNGKILFTGLKAHTLWRYIQDLVHFEIHAGLIGIDASYQLEFIDGQPLMFNLDETAITLKELTLRPTTEEREMLHIPGLQITDASLRLSEKKLHLARVELDSGRVAVQRDAQGELDWLNLVSDGEAKKGEPDEPDRGGPDEPDRGDEENDPWEIRVDEFSVRGFSFALKDYATPHEADLTAESINLRAANFSNTPGALFDLDLGFLFASKGQVTLQGRAGAFPPFLDASLAIMELPLMPFQPYIEAAARLEIASGSINTKGTVQYQEKPDSPDGRFSGTTTIGNLITKDRLVGERLISWDALSFEGIQAELLPSRLHIESITAKSPFAKILIAEDGQVNIIDVLSAGKDERGGEEKKETSRPAEVVPIEIGRIRVEQGSSDFTDLSLSPQFSAVIQELKGEIAGLSSENLARADVDLSGKVGTYGSVAVKGQVNPLSEDAYTDLDVIFSNIEVTTLSPYSGKFVGYVIDKGKLSLDLNYKLSQRELIGENKIVLDQLTLGERTDSPDAAKLPIPMALALLKDVQGVIDVDLPVRGNLDDPEFSLGGIIVKALVNLVTKAAASPFSLLGSLVGASGESMSLVAFPPGSTVLSETEQEKLLQLAGALKQRPALHLEVQGGYHQDGDGLALRKSRFEQVLAVDFPKFSQASEKKQLDILEDLFKEHFGKDDLGALRSRFETTPAPRTPDQEPEEDYRTTIQSRLVQSQPLAEGELLKLAQDRAMAVKDHLVQKGEIVDLRIFILVSEATEQSQGGLVPTGLNVSVK